MFLFRAECQDSILAQFSELPAGASRLHFGSFRQNGTRCMPESLGAPGLRKRTPPTRSLFASFAGCRQDNSGQAWGTRASGLNVGLVGCQDRRDLEEAADLQRKRRPTWPRSGGRRSRQGAGGQRHGERDQSRFAPLEQHVGRGCKSGESVELRKSAEDISREVDPFREERRVATKTARVCGGGRTACFV